MPHEHPDPEGHLTDLTITALVKLRDDLPVVSEDGEYWAGHRVATLYVRRALNEILEPWGEGPTDD